MNAESNFVIFAKARTELKTQSVERAVRRRKILIVVALALAAAILAVLATVWPSCGTEKIYLSPVDEIGLLVQIVGK